MDRSPMHMSNCFAAPSLATFKGGYEGKAWAYP